GNPRFDYTLAGTTVFQFLVDDVHALAAGELRPRLLLNLGIAVLLFTPYLRVFASVVYFAFVERNAKYTVFTAFVLLTLTYSLLRWRAPSSGQGRQAAPIARRCSASVPQQPPTAQRS